MKMVKKIARRFLDRLPDEAYLKLKFRLRMGKKLDLKDPKTFNEKLQWLKLYDRKPEYTTMVDKAAAKEYVAEKIGGQYVIPTLGVWETFDDIDFDALPEKFVLKCTHDSGGLVICRDKGSVNREEAREKIEKALKTNYYLHGREWPYKNVKPRILAEAYMEDGSGTGLTDYKFFCFNAEPKMLYVSRGLEDHATASISFYDFEGKQMAFRRKDFKPIEGPLVLPENFGEMQEIARRIAETVGCSFVRVDLYSIQGNVYFSEITFSPCSGMLPFEPESWDERLGSWIRLPEK